MSKKRTADWTDHLMTGGSNLPADEMTFTDASTYGLESFQFDTDFGAGVEESPARLPEMKGLSGLPDGFVRTAEPDLDIQELTEMDDGSDLSEMLSEEEGGLPVTAEQKKEASLIDLTWLDPTQEQDEDRLPVNPVNVKPELEDTWTGNRPPNGLVPNKDREIAKYEQSIQEGQTSELPGEKNASDEEVRDAILHATRLAHYGRSMNEIKGVLVARLGNGAARTRKAVELIELDHGLAGNVFVRASAFPGIRNGKWVQEIRKFAKGARYVITDDEAVSVKLGMQMVSEVPWDEALQHYRPLLKAAGYKLSNSGNGKNVEREILRNAFLEGPVAVAVVPTPKPQGQVLATPKGPDASVQVKSADEQSREKKIKAALVEVARWVKAGRLSQPDALRLHVFSQTPQLQDTDILKAATDLMVATKDTPVYEGSGNQFPKHAWAARQAVWESLESRQKGIDQGLLRKVQVHLAKEVKVGNLTAEEARRIFNLNKTASAHEIETKIAAAILAAHDLRQKPATPDKVADYDGTVMKAAKPVEWKRPEENQGVVDQSLVKNVQVHLARQVKAGNLTAEEARRIFDLGGSVQEIEERMAAAVHAAQDLRQDTPPVAQVQAYEGAVQKFAQQVTPEIAPLTGEVKGLVRWARQQMSEGMAGSKLDQLLSVRFSKPLMKAASSALTEIRVQHEGLAGHLYVDASAYATPEGVTGCEKGALKHRANALKFVRAMKRCASCVHAVDGACQKYNKKLAYKVPVADPKEYQKESLRLADAPDHELTAAMFDPAEYGLHNAAIDDVSMDPALPTKELSDVLFGGMELEE